MTTLARRQFLQLAAGAVALPATGCEELNHIPTSVAHKRQAPFTSPDIERVRQSIFELPHLAR